MIITVGREYASDGHRIGELAAGKLGIRLYDKESLAEEARASNMYDELRDFYEGQPVNSLLYSIAAGSYSAGKQGKIPFDFIRRVAARESCVMIGRGGNYILRDNPGLVSVFIYAPEKDRISRIMRDYGVSEQKALHKLEMEDKVREEFYTYYTDEKWNQTSGYDLCINSSSMSAEDAADMIIEFAKRKLKIK